MKTSLAKSSIWFNGVIWRVHGGSRGGAGRAMVGAWWEPDFLPNKDERICFVKRLEDCPTSPQGSKMSPGQWMQEGGPQSRQELF